MILEQKQTRKWRYGKNRWFVLLVLILGVIGARAFAPVQPHIQLPAESLSKQPLFTSKLFGEFYFTNTMTALLIVMAVLIFMALFVRNSVNKSLRNGDYVPKGVAGVLEALLEYLYNLTEATAGKKWTKTIFPWFATITLMVLLANWMELIPGVDSIGLLEPSAHGHAIQQVLPGVDTIIKQEAQDGEGYTLIPFVRTLSTDLNFTIALALIAVSMVQVVGVKAQGMKYFTKFWNTKNLFSKPFFGAIDWVVGLLEIISEISKILSFGFRLFGNIFAGSVMLFVIGSLIPVFAQSIFVGLELFVGAIQALVFGMLTMVFMSMATKGHGE